MFLYMLLCGILEMLLCSCVALAVPVKCSQLLLLQFQKLAFCAVLTLLLRDCGGCADGMCAVNALRA